MQAILEKIEGLPAPRVRLTVTNDSRAHVHLAKDRLCLRGTLDGDHFAVDGAGTYTGGRRNPAPYCSDELVTLAAGEELSVEIELARWYELRAGATVRYHAAHSSIFSRVELESNPVEF